MDKRFEVKEHDDLSVEILFEGKRQMLSTPFPTSNGQKRYAEKMRKLLSEDKNVKKWLEKLEA